MACCAVLHVPAGWGWLCFKHQVGFMHQARLGAAEGGRLCNAAWQRVGVVGMVGWA